MTHELQVIAAGSGVGAAENPHGPPGSWMPTFVFICPFSDTENGTVLVSMPGAEVLDLRFLADTSALLADGIEAHVDYGQITAMLRPLYERQRAAADAQGKGMMTAEGSPSEVDAVLAAHHRLHVVTEPEPPPEAARCIVCSRRIFGEVAERGCCLTCSPPLPDGEVDLDAAD